MIPTEVHASRRPHNFGEIDERYAANRRRINQARRVDGSREGNLYLCAVKD